MIRNLISVLLCHRAECTTAINSRVFQRWLCPDCGGELLPAMCCTPDDEWLWVCPEHPGTYTTEELTERALDMLDMGRDQTITDADRTRAEELVNEPWWDKD